MSLTELPPEPTPQPEGSHRLQRLEVKVNTLLVLVSILILYPIIGWLFGVVQTSAWLLLVLLVVAFVVAMFRDRIPGVLKRAGRWLILKAVNTSDDSKK